jgi:uncharacterized SAM-binding protein YcdF (DUF218 family)
MFKKKIKKRYYVLGLIVLLHLVLLSTCAINSKNRHKLYEKAIAEKPFDAIIVPGYPFKDGEWEKVMRGRVVWSYHLYQKGITKNVIYSGSAVYSPYIESEIMALYAEALGIPKENIFTESRAEHSTENVYYSYQLGESLGFKKMALASDPFQTKLLKLFIKSKVSKDLSLIPILYDTLMVIDTINPIIDPSSAYVEDFVSIEDRESKWERFKGTQGKQIDYEEYKE